MRRTGLRATSGPSFSFSAAVGLFSLFLSVAAGLLLVLPVQLEAQAIRGTVVDSTGRPLAGAAVMIAGSINRAETDSLGRFVISGVRIGAYTLRVRLIGYRPYEQSVRSGRGGGDLSIVLRRLPQLIGAVTIVDTHLCSPNTIAGFECRRQGRAGMFRDAGEIRSMRAETWADMLDGMPDLRRVAIETPYGLGWRVTAPPSKCLVEIYNGEDPMFDGHVRRVPTNELIPADVIAIEYYNSFADVPLHFQRFAWPSTSISPCNLIVYWLRVGSGR